MGQLKQKLTDEDLALLEIIEDGVLLGEFLRTTANGEMNRSLWPKQPFRYRPYQAMLLTDETEYISVCAGRAVGKCAHIRSRVYTDKGYKTIAELLKLPSFLAYTLDKENNLVLRRAKVYPNKYEPVYRLITESGHYTDVNKKHPFLTPSGDWVELRNLKVGDHVAVATKLPELHNPYHFEWHELRWLGYILFIDKPGSEQSIKLRFRKQVAEMKLIAKKFNQVLMIEEDRIVTLQRDQKRFFLRNNATWLLLEVGYTKKLSNNGLYYLTDKIMELPNDALKIFLEAAFSQHAELSLQEVTFTHRRIKLIRQLQELLLRFGIETKIIEKPEEATLTLYDARAIHTFYTTFNLPGVTVNSTILPQSFVEDELEHLRFEPVTSIEQYLVHPPTYAVYVYEHHNYIGDNLYVHNSLVLEDKIVYEVVNADREFPVTKEQLLTTANQAQLNPILDRLITRFSGGKLIQSFLQNHINKSQGVLKFPAWQFIFTARIAAGKGESNLVCN